jgi:hypothetical protein
MTTATLHALVQALPEGASVTLTREALVALLAGSEPHEMSA